MNDIKEKLWNIELVVNDINKFPQTYKTILGEFCKDGTCQIILRRKINKLCKLGTICKTTIPGTRFGQVILYVLPKKYQIVIVAERLGNDVYCFFDYKRIGRYYVEINEWWLLNGKKWDKRSDTKKIFEGSVLKWI